MLLVTTAIEKTWGSDEDVLFLGAWCKNYARRHVYEQRTYQTLRYIWDDRVQLYSDYEFLSEIYERLLLQLGAKLNEIHGTCHSDKYWRILLGPWLGFFVQILFQRWSSISSATSNFKVTDTVLLTDKTICMVPNEMSEFTNMMAGDRWNHFICGRILQYQGDVSCTVLNSDEDDSNVIHAKRPSIRHRLRVLLVATWNFCLSPFVKQKDLFFIQTYLPFFEELKLKLRFRQVPQNIRSEPLHSVPLNVEKRKWHLQGDNDNNFDSFLRMMIPDQIPKLYLEGFENIKKHSASLTWPKSPKVIFTSNSHMFDDLVKNWVASKVEEGSCLVIGQHGGGPFHSINFQTEHELAICDRYLSPGKGNTWHPKVRNVGQLFARKWKNDPEGGALLIQLSTPRYSFAIASMVQSDDYTKYLNAQMRFVQLLPSRIRNSLTVRLNEDNYLHCAQERWHDRFPDIAIDPGIQNIHRIFSQSRLIICTYAATTYNQTIAANAPTIIFWDPKYSQLHESTKPYFDDLKRVGIFHETPESAAKHVSKIWDNVDAWWQCPEVQEVRKSFCENYAYLPEDLLCRIEAVLREVMVESKIN